MTTAIPVCFVLPDLGGGGAQRVMLELAKGLDPRIFDVTLVVFGGSQILADHILSDQVPAGMRVIRLGAERLRQAIPRLVGCLRRLRPAIIISVMGYINLAVLALRPMLKGNPRIIVREANVVAATLAALPAWLPARWLYRRLYRRADAIIAPISAIAAELAALVPAARARTVVLCNPVNEASLRLGATPPYRPPGEGLVLVSAGRLTEQKGFDRLIELMPGLPSDARLTIYGVGPNRGDIERRIERLGLRQRVTLAGFNTVLPMAVAGADVFVLPSRWEGLPNVALEALAVGVPVVASEEAHVEELAEAAGHRAVTIAKVGQAFIDAICRHAPATSAPVAPRPSLLPASYRIEAVISQFSEVLQRVCRT